MKEFKERRGELRSIASAGQLPGTWRNEDARSASRRACAWARAVVVGTEDALAPGAPLLYNNNPGNLAFEYEYGNEAAVNAAFSRAAHVTRIKLDSARVVGNPMEPKACVVAFDKASGMYDVHACTQGMSL